MTAAPTAPPGHVEGLLEEGSGVVPVRLGPLTRLTLAATFSGGAPESGTEWPSLTVSLPSGHVKLGRCRYEAPAAAGEVGRLLFLDDVYDCTSLIGEGRAVALTHYLDQVPVVLAQKDSVPSDFKAYVSDLLYGMSVFEKFFNEQDRMYAEESPEVSARAQTLLIEREGYRLLGYLATEAKRLDALVGNLNRETYERCGSYFRRVMWDFILGSEFLRRTNLKPRGYAGDAEMMRMLYEHQHVGRYAFNKLLHYFPASRPGAQAVRNRRAMVPRVLKEVAARGDQPRRFFSVACGPAWELRDVYAAPEEATRWTGLLLDQDTEALDMARHAVAEVEHRLGQRLGIEFVNDSVRTMLRTPDLSSRFGTFDVIYSMGLFDYLTPPVAKAVLGKLFGLLNPGGVLVVGNYHQGHADQHYMAFWADWVLYLRTEAEMLELTEGLTGATPAITFDESGCQMFLTVECAP